jgi:hypothetical protein
MIVRSTGPKENGTRQLVMYETDGSGKCSGELRPSDFDAEIPVYHEQRHKEFVRLHARLFAGDMSPIGFFIELQRMSVGEVATRLRLRASVVKSHTTPEGFERIPIEMLRRYARLFDLSVGDFFQFVELAGQLTAEVKPGQGGLLQHIRVAAGSAEPGACG